jgi:Fic/DOC family
VSSRLHAQFETIHPLLDGSGGVGRLLITLILAGEKALACPLLYVSLFFEQHRSEYDERLQRIRSHGDWESWIVFYLTGIREVSTQGAETAGRIVRLFDEDSGAILDSDGGVHSMTRLFDPSKRKMYVSVPEAVEQARAHGSKGRLGNRTVGDARCGGRGQRNESPQDVCAFEVPDDPRGRDFG